MPLEIYTPPAAPPRYPHMEWAYANGYSKKYASSGWMSYDSLFFRWAERAGYQVDLASQHELHFTPEILDGYDCAAFVGHDEYWTWEMRDAVDDWVERGGLQILALGMSSLKEESADIPADDQFLSDADAKFVAEILQGDNGDAAVDRIKRGCGMIVNFPRGDGEVFHAGSCEWAAALKRGDAMVERVTANVLDRYLGRNS